MKAQLIKRINLPEERRVNVDLNGVVVGIGKIMSVSKHPNADIIRIATVDVGNNNQQLKIIFGGPNIEKVGNNVAVALPGTVTDDGRLKRQRYGGEVSQAMICSAVELGLINEGPDEIMILPDTFAVGTPSKVIGKTTLKKLAVE